MTPAPPVGLLAEVAIAGVRGLPHLRLELGPMTALVGALGSGKSQLLSAIAWLIAGRPAIVTDGDATVTEVSGRLAMGDRMMPILRTPGARLGRGPGRTERLLVPRLSYLRARDRFAPPRAASGSLGQRFTMMAGRGTSDAASAEALLAVLEACCREGWTGEILLIEEPELLLTPQAQRYLYRLLRRFADAGNQVMYSTRSPAFVDAAHHEEIVRLDIGRGRRSLRRTSPRALSDLERLRLGAEFDHERSEMFFARAVVLVEGRTERISFPFIFRALGHDPDAEGIAIVEVGGKSNLPNAARLLRQLRIPFVTVIDADRGADSAALEVEIRRAAGRAPVIALVPDFEGAAGITARNDKVYQAWRRFAPAGPDAIPAALAQVVATAMRLQAQVSAG